MPIRETFVRGIAACTLIMAALAAPAGPVEADSVVRIGLPQQPNTLNPLIGAQFYENFLDCAIYSGLVVIDDRGNPIPDIIQDVPTRRNGGISADGKTIIYTLRPGVKWSDNVNLFAGDVAFTFRRMRDPKTGFPATSAYENVESVEARDRQTVVVRLKNPDPDVLSKIFVNGQNGSIVPRHILEHVDDMQRAPFNDHPIGSGPYVVESWQRDSGMRLRANRYYFKGRPAIDSLRIAFIPDSNTLTLQLRSGDLDFAPTITPSAVATLRQVKGLHIQDARGPTVVMLVNRVNAPPLDDARVRRALGLAADRKAIANKAYLGHAEPAAELVPSWSPWATFRNAPLANPKEASALLDAAGWKRGTDGIRTRGGQRLSLTLATIAGTRALLSAATLLQAAWRDVGIDVSLRPIQANQLFAPDGTLARSDFTFALIGDGFAVAPDRSGILASSSIPPDGLNYARYRNGDVDRDITVAAGEVEPKVRRAALGRIARAVDADSPYAALYWVHTILAISTKLQGVKPEPVNSDLWNVAQWKLR